MNNLCNEDFLKLALAAVIIISIILFLLRTKHWYVFTIGGLLIVGLLWYWTRDNTQYFKHQSSNRVEHYRCRNRGKWNTTSGVGGEIGKLTPVGRY